MTSVFFCIVKTQGNYYNTQMQNPYKKTINNLIAADDLHWQEDEQKYVALSSEELDQIIFNCIQQEIYDEEKVMAIVKWATHVKVGSLLFKNFLNNQIKVIDVDKDGEPYFDTI